MKPRQVIAGRVHLFTRRTAQRQLLLTPDEHVVRTYEYLLAEAAAQFNITIYGWVLMGNHQHVLFRDNEGNYPKFIERLDALLTRVLNPYRNRRENMWSSDQPSVVWVVEDADKFAKLIYILANPVAAHLVDKAVHWPGSSSLSLNLSGRSKVINRPVGVLRKDGPMPAKVTLRCARLEGFEGVSQSEWEKMVLAAVAEAEAKAREERREAKRRVVGSKAVRRARPTDTPATVEPRNGLKPTVAAKDSKVRLEALETLRAFREAHETALRRWIDRESNVWFPIGTYRMCMLGAQSLSTRAPCNGTS